MESKRLKQRFIDIEQGTIIQNCNNGFIIDHGDAFYGSGSSSRGTKELSDSYNLIMLELWDNDKWFEEITYDNFFASHNNKDTISFKFDKPIDVDTLNVFMHFTEQIIGIHLKKYWVDHRSGDECPIVIPERLKDYQNTNRKER